MANVTGIEVGGTTYDLEDTTARDNATSAAQTATTASQTAETAQTTAETAQTTAETAQTTAETADEKIGDLADLETTAKTNLVSAVNEVVGNVEKKNLLWNNPNPTAEMASTSISLSISANAKGLLIRAGFISTNEHSVIEDRMFFASGKSCGISISSSVIDYDSSEQFISARYFNLNPAHTSLEVGYGSRLVINLDEGTTSVAQRNKLLVPQEIYEIL